MGIQKRHRGGERNFYQRKTTQEVAKDVELEDLSEVVNRLFTANLSSRLGGQINFEFHNSTTIATTHSNGDQVAYHIDFYPLDVNLSSYEAGAVLVAKTRDNAAYLPAVVREIVAEQVENICNEVERVRKYHPGSPLTLIFAPADTLSYAGKISQPIYAFYLNANGVRRFECETSFLVIPDNEPSKAYGEEV